MIQIILVKTFLAIEAMLAAEFSQDQRQIHCVGKRRSSKVQFGLFSPVCSQKIV